MLGLAFVAIAGWVDFRRNYLRDQAAARKWRELRWSEWKALEKRYRDEVYANMPPSVSGLNDQIAAAERRARDEIMERFGPVT